MGRAPLLHFSRYARFRGSSFAAQRYTGKPMDADCSNSKQVATQESGHKTYHEITKTCAATGATTNFAVRITGSPYNADVGNTIKLDDAGNAQAMSEMPSGVPTADRHGNVRVRVRGKLLGETLTNALIDPRHGHIAARVTQPSGSQPLISTPEYGSMAIVWQQRLRSRSMTSRSSG